MKRHFLLTLFVLGTLPLAAQTGSIRGVVYDARSGTPLPGADVYLEGEKIGTSTDHDGSYFLLKVPVGKHRLVASMLGYRKSSREVKVREGEALEIDFYLEEEAINIGEEIVVIGKRPLLEPEVSASLKSLSTSDLENMPVEEVKDVLASQAGVSGVGSDIHIRGGRSNEIIMLVDGIPVRDPLSGSAFGLYIPTDMVQSLDALVGGFSAEYGEAMSGVINIKTKEGGEKLGGYFGYQSDHIKPLNYHNTDRLEFSLDGPVPLSGGRATFYTSLYYRSSDTYLPHSDELYSSVIKKTFGREENTLSGIFKLSVKPGSNKKLSLSFNKSIEVNQGYFSTRRDYPFAYGFPYRYMYHLEHYPVFTRDGNQFILSFNHLLSEKSFYEVKFSRFFTNLHLDVLGKKWDQYEELLDILPPVSDTHPYPGDGFYDTGDSPIWHDHYDETYTLKFDFTRKPRPIFRMKTGFELDYSEVQWIDIQYPWFYSPDGLGYNHDLYKVYTTKFGAYYENRIHFAGMVANLGIRYDMWVPGKYVDRGVERTLSYPDLPPAVEREYRRYLDESGKLPIFGLRHRSHVSPRIGVAFPITESDKFFFSYGHFSQMPDFKYVYSKLGVRASSTYELVGNPNLKPTVTVAYEMGMEHLFGQYTKLAVTAYYKDIFNYPTAVKVKGIPPNPDFWMYFNSDYARALGLEFSFTKSFSNHYRASLDFSLSQAKGKASTSEDAYYRGQTETLKEWYLKWDRPYKLYADFGLNYGKGEHPSIGPLRLPDNWALDLSFSFQAGRRYTPMDSLGNYGEINSALGPPWTRTDLSLRKYFEFKFGGKLCLVLEIKNLFNHRNVYYVNPLTGKAYEPGDPLPPYRTERDMLNPARYRAPRSMRLGLEVKW